MNVKQAEESAASGAKSQRAARSRILRAVVYGSVGIFALLVYLERSARQAATETGEVWARIVAQRARDPNQELWQSELADYIQGRPVMVRSDPEKYRAYARLLETYTWRGPLDDYRVDVYLGSVRTFIGRGDDWPVYAVQGTDVTSTEDEEP